MGNVPGSEGVRAGSVRIAGATSEHFSEGELRCRGRGCCGRINGCTQKLVDALEALRAIAGQPVIIFSAYRCKAHNALIGGAPSSQHVLGNAADIWMADKTPAEIEALAREVSAFKGIGRDDFTGYVHVDVRDEPAQWCYTKAGSPRAYYAPGTGTDA